MLTSIMVPRPGVITAANLNATQVKNTLNMPMHTEAKIFPDTISLRDAGVVNNGSKD